VVPPSTDDSVWSVELQAKDVAPWFKEELARGTPKEAKDTYFEFATSEKGPAFIINENGRGFDPPLRVNTRAISSHSKFLGTVITTDAATWAAWNFEMERLEELDDAAACK
jgi:hypothetical protein